MHTARGVEPGETDAHGDAFVFAEVVVVLAADDEGIIFPNQFQPLSTVVCGLSQFRASDNLPPPVRPAPMPLTHRRPRTVDTSMPFCPHSHCDYRGWLGLNNLRANGHPSGGPWRQLHCTSCDGYFPEHHGTILHGQQPAVELNVRVLYIFIK